METNIDKIVRLGLLFLLIAGSFIILAPFMIMLVWGIIIAVASYPSFSRLVERSKGRKNLLAVLFVIIGVSVILIPSILLGESSTGAYVYIQTVIDSGNLHIPSPPDHVATWPLIGEQLHKAWHLAAHNLREFVNTYSEQLSAFGAWLLNTLANLGLTIIKFIVSIIIAGVLLAYSEAGNQTVHKFGKKLVGDESESFIKLVSGTIRSVVQGIVGIALIQALATALLLFISGIPLAVLWTVGVLILAILQLPPFLILAPIVVYAFSVMNTTPAVIFTVFALLISMSDSLLKPIFLGRGVDIPMLVVLLGAIGGMLAFGLLGLFVGAVVLALSYKLMMAWVEKV